MSQSMNCWPSSFFTRRCLAGLTRMTPYWLNSSLSPWKVGLVLERKPRAAIRHHIGSAGCCCVERGTHALPDRFVPRPSLLLDVDADALPEIDFRNMRAGVVAARDEGCTFGLNGLQRKGDVPCPLDAGGIVLRSDDDKIVVHHRIAFHAKPFCNEFLLCLPGMH